MATAVNSLTLDEFRRHYADRKPYFEYWFGEAIQKPVQTTVHGILQQIICALLKAAGYRVGSEIELRIDEHWQPKPDVLASSQPFEQPYPTKPIDLVVEILSDDRMQMIFEKCRNYTRIGIARVFVLSGDLRVAWEWSSQADNLERVASFKLPNGETIELTTIWQELDRELS